MSSKQMNRRWFGLFLALFLVVVGCGSEPGVQVGETPDASGATTTPVDGVLVAGVFPFLPPSQLDQIYGPLINEMAQDLGIDVQLRTSTSFDAYSDDLAAGRFDIALVQPFDYPALIDSGYTPIARVEDPLVATLVAPPDLVLTQPGILGAVGLRIGTPPRSSAMRYLLDAEMIGAGVDLSTLDIQLFSTHADCLGQVQLGTVDVCVVARAPLASFEEATGQELQVVAVTEAVNSIAFIGRPGIKPELAQRVQTFLLGLDDDPSTRPILAELGFTRYMLIGDDDYDRARELISIAASE